MGDRHDDPRPVKCEDCGWEAQVRDCRHGYAKIAGTEDVEPVDYCPECGSKNLTIG